MTARHSTGVAEPVPAVDDELIRDLHQELPRWFFYGNNVAHRIGDLLASEPMQRLRVAWTAEAVDDYRKHIAAVRRERDEARALIAKLESNLGERTEQVFTAVEQRDEARTECESLRLFPPLPIARARASAYPGGGVRAWLVGEPEPTTGWWSAREHAAKQAAIALAVVREFDRMDREAKEGAARRHEAMHQPHAFQRARPTTDTTTEVLSRIDDTLTELGEDPR